MSVFYTYINSEIQDKRVYSVPVHFLIEAVPDVMRPKAECLACYTYRIIIMCRLCKYVIKACVESVPKPFVVINRCNISVETLRRLALLIFTVYITVSFLNRSNVHGFFMYAYTFKLPKRKWSKIMLDNVEALCC